MTRSLSARHERRSREAGMGLFNEPVQSKREIEFCKRLDKVQYAFFDLQKELETVTAERDALLALLREAYPHIWPGDCAYSKELRARIYALLNKGGEV